MDATCETLHPAKPAEKYYGLPPEVRDELDEVVFSSLPLRDVWDRILDIALRLLGARYGSLRGVDYRTQKLVLEALRGTDARRTPIHSREIGLNEKKSVLTKVLSEKKAQLVSDTKAKHWKPYYSPLDKGLETRSELAVPIFSSDRGPSAKRAVIAVLNVESYVPYAFTLQHQHWLLALAQRARMVMQRARLSDATRTITNKMLAMDLDTLLVSTVETLADLLYVPVCALWLLDRTSGELVLRKAVGRQATEQEIRLTLESFLGKALYSPTPLYLPDVRHDSTFVCRELAQKEGWVSGLAIPIRSSCGESLGVISAYSVNEEREFLVEDQDKSLVITFANHVAMVLQHALHLRVLNALFTESVLADDYNKFIHEAALRIHRELGYRIDICLVADNGDSKVNIFKTTVHHNGTIKDNVMTLPFDQGITGLVASSGKSCIVPDVSQHTSYHLDDPATKSELAVPLKDTQHEVIGVMNIESTTLNAFTPEHQQVFETIATGFSFELENIRRHRERIALRTVSEVVSRNQDLDQSLEQTAETVRQLFNAHVCTLYLVSPYRDHLVLTYPKELPGSLARLSPTLQKGQSNASEVLESGQPRVVWDLLDDERTRHLITPDDNLRSLMDVPMRTNKGILGVLGVLTADKRYFTMHDVKVLEEISNHVAMAIEKHRTDRLYRQLYRNARDPMFIVDENGRIRDANRAASKALGYTDKELLQKNLMQLVVEAQADEVRNRLACIRKEEEVPIQTFEIQRKDNTSAFFEANLTPIRDPNNTLTAIQVIWRDVTEREETAAKMHRRNQQLKALLDFTQHALRPFEHSDLVSRIVQSAAELLESDACVMYLLQNDLLREACTFPKSNLDELAASHTLLPGEGPIGQVIWSRSGGIFNEIALDDNPYCIPPSLGGPRAQHVMALPMKAQEEVMGVLSVSRYDAQHKPSYTPEDKEYLGILGNLLTLDHTYRHLLKVQHEQRTAVTIVEQMDVIGGFFAHRVRSLLGALRITASLLYENLQRSNVRLTDDTARWLDTLLVESRAVEPLWKQLSNLQKPANQQREVISLTQVVEVAIQRSHIPGHIRPPCPPLQLPQVSAKHDLLAEVIEGLLRNAVEAMPQGGTVSIDSRTNSDRSMVWLEVSDTGHGISADNIENLFIPFFTTKGAQGGGAGLGLWLSRLYLRTLGGDIDLTMTSSTGSTFMLWLPAVQSSPGPVDTSCLPSLAQETLTENSLPPALQEELVSDFSNRALMELPPDAPHVLVVEDSDVWQKIFSTCLTAKDLEIDIAPNHQEALSCLDNQEFVACVVDVNLDMSNKKNMEGLDIVRHIRSRYPSLPIIIASAWMEQLEEANKCFGGQANIQIVDKNSDDPQAIKDVFDRLVRNIWSSI